MAHHPSDGNIEREAELTLHNGTRGGGTLHILGTDFSADYRPASIALILALQEAKLAGARSGGWCNAAGILRLLRKDPGTGDPGNIVSRLVCNVNRPFRELAAADPSYPRLIATWKETGYRLQYRLKIILPGDLPADDA